MLSILPPSCTYNECIKLFAVFFLLEIINYCKDLNSELQNIIIFSKNKHISPFYLIKCHIDTYILHGIIVSISFSISITAVAITNIFFNFLINDSEIIQEIRF